MISPPHIRRIKFYQLAHIYRTILYIPIPACFSHRRKKENFSFFSSHLLFRSSNRKSVISWLWSAHVSALTYNIEAFQLFFSFFKHYIPSYIFCYVLLLPLKYFLLYFFDHIHATFKKEKWNWYQILHSPLSFYLL